MNKLSMKKSLLILAAIVLCGVVPSCSSDDEDDNPKTVTLSYHSESGCKAFVASSGAPQAKAKFYNNIIERVTLRGNNKGVLSISHENAVFTCEAQFNITADVSGNTIVIHEDAPPTTNCICYYDLMSEVEPLENKTYMLIIKNNNAIVCMHQFRYSGSLYETFNVK